MPEQQKISWKAPEHGFRQKGRDWYIVVGIIVLGGAAAAILLDNMLFAILVFISGATLALVSFKTPRDVKFELNSRGIVVEDKLYPFGTLEAFGIDHEPTPKLLVRSKKAVMPLLAIPLPDELVEDVRDFLELRLDEEELREPLLQKLVEHFGL